MRIFKGIAASAGAIAVLAWLLPTVSYQNLVTLLLTAIVLTLLQQIIRPILEILFLPINIVTLGFFSLVINVTLLWLVTYLVPGFNIQPMTVLGIHLNYFFSLLFISFLISFFQALFRTILK